MLNVPFLVEDTCAATGVQIRVDFAPGGYVRGGAARRPSRRRVFTIKEWFERPRFAY